MNASYKNGASNTTKETSSLDMYSNASSSDMFMFKKLRDQSLEKKELSFDSFEKLFKQMLGKINFEKNDE